MRSLPARVLDDGPAPLVQGLPSARYEKTVKHCLMTLMQGKDTREDEGGQFSNFFTTRPPSELAAVDADILEALDVLQDTPSWRKRNRRRTACLQDCVHEQVTLPA